jgi:RNA polymerase sigma-70 factor (ECF subfamily)
VFGIRKNKISEKKLNKAVEDFNSGSAEAFHILYQEYQAKVYRFCLRMLGNEELARDAFQETFIKVYQKSGQFRGDNFKAWLFTVARNHCLNIIRSAKEQDTFDEAFHNPAASNFEDFGKRDFVKNAISKLPDALREAVILREYEELSYKEIAEVLNIELSLAKVRVHRARNLLREMLEPLVKEINEN